MPLSLRPTPSPQSLLKSIIVSFDLSPPLQLVAQISHMSDGPSTNQNIEKRFARKDLPNIAVPKFRMPQNGAHKNDTSKSAIIDQY